MEDKNLEAVYVEEVVLKRIKVDPEDVISLSDAKRLMGRSYSTVVSLVDRRDLPAIKYHPKESKVYTLKSAVLGYMKAHPKSEVDQEGKEGGKLSDISGYRSIPNAQRARTPAMATA